MASFDLNLSPTNDESHFFYLNIIPGNTENYDSEYGGLRDEVASVFAAEEAEANLESEDVDVTVVESSESTLVLDLNVNPAEDTNPEIVELVFGEEGIYALQLDVFSYSNCTSLRLRLTY